MRKGVLFTKAVRDLLGNYGGNTRQSHKVLSPFYHNSPSNYPSRSQSVLQKVLKPFSNRSQTVLKPFSNRSQTVPIPFWLWCCLSLRDGVTLSILIFAGIAAAFPSTKVRRCGSTLSNPS